MKLSHVWTILLVVAALVSCLFFVSSCRFESYDSEEEIHDPPARAARRNPLLAAERFLVAMDVRASHAETLTRIPESTDVLVLLAPRRRFGEQREQDVLDWASRGGHLILAPREDGAGDSMLVCVGITSHGAASDAAAEASAKLLVPTRDGKESIEVEGSFRAWQETEGFAALEWAVGEEGGPRVCRFGYGTGFVTVVPSAEMFRNDRIGTAQHARLLWRLVTLAAPRPRVLLVAKDDMPGITSLIAEQMPFALIAAALALLVCLWRAGVRVGPLLAEPERARRGLLEHIAAIGAYFWRARRADVLLHAARERLARRLALRHPERARQPVEERAAWLAQAAHAPVEHVEAALASHAPPDARAFVRAIQTLQALERIR